MNLESMQPYGAALQAYFAGNSAAELIVRRDDGQEARLPVSHFSRDPSDFTSIEKTAIERCAGHVLDAGAGTGLHSLALQVRGLRVTAIDINPEAAGIMVRRGVRDVRCTDIFELEGGPFDTVLMLGHGIGIVETLAGLDRLLGRLGGLVAVGGVIVLDSLDVRISEDPKNLAYLEANRREGRYEGEIRMQLEFAGIKGPYCGWLQVDVETLARHALRAGWKCEKIAEEPTGDYLAMLTRP